jgi:hypothetical protein
VHRLAAPEGHARATRVENEERKRRELCQPDPLAHVTTAFQVADLRSAGTGQPPSLL